MSVTARRYRGLLDLDALGLGCSALGGMYRHISESTAASVVERAYEGGVRYFDVAPSYGNGTAERRLGQALRGVDRSSYTLSTKVGRLVRPVSGSADTGIFVDAPSSVLDVDFSRDGVLRSLDASLERLRTDQVDIVYIHDPDDHPDQALREAYPALHELRSQGVVKAIGVGMNGPALPARFIRETDIDVVLLAGRYTLLDQTGSDELLPLARREHVAVVAGGVFNSGILASPTPDSRFDYAPAPAGHVARAQRMQALCDRFEVSLPAAALAFTAAGEGVSTVLIGAASASEVEANLAARRQTLPDALWAELAAAGLVPAHLLPQPTGATP